MMMMMSLTVVRRTCCERETCAHRTAHTRQMPITPLLTPIILLSVSLIFFQESRTKYEDDVRANSQRKNKVISVKISK